MMPDSPTPIPFSHFVAHTATDVQLIHILSQMQTHQFTTNQAVFSFLSFSIPFLSMDAKLALYHVLLSLPIPLLPPWLIALFFVISPFIGIGIILLGYKLIPQLIEGFTMLMTFYFSKNQQKSFLALTFPHDTSKSAYATEQLYTLLHTVGRIRQGWFRPQKTYALEIISTLDDGISFVLGVPTCDVDVIRKSLLSYLPGLCVKEIPDYLPNAHLCNTVSISSQKEEKIKTEKSMGVLEFILSNDFPLPLNDQKKLGVHDSIAFLTGNMTKPKKGEIISFQIILTPVLGLKIKQRMQEIKNAIYQGKQLSPLLNKSRFLSGVLPPLFLCVLSPIVWLTIALGRLVIHLPYLLLDPNGPQSTSYFDSSSKIPLQTILNPYEQELTAVVKEKLSQHLFETSIRCFIVTLDEASFDTRQSGLISSFGQFASEYQSLITKDLTIIPFFSDRAWKKRVVNFYSRNVSRNPVILSSSELSDLYHFPNMDITRIEGLAKSKSNELPVPIAMKRAADYLDILVGKNSYGGEETGIGLRKQDRGQHTYIIGKTGMGKSTIIEGMALQDIQNNKGVAVIDPHGDMVEHLLLLIPASRQKDVIYLNPFDRQFPSGLNILRPGTVYADQEEEQQRIAGIVMSIFMKITPEKYWGQRMEHILRNAILTVLQISTGTTATPYISLYAIQKLLTDSSYRKSVAGNLADPILKQFWEKEYALFTKNKQADVISPLTNKIGEFITDPLSRNMLLQKESTINMSEIMNQGKIILVNLSKGNLGEERSAFFGTVITSLIQLATYARTQIPEKERRDFFVYIDEFQNFATPHFTDLFSESRKYHVFFTPSHQNIAQIDDPKLSKIIKGNSGVFIALKGSADDEKVLLPLFSPEVKEGQIVNLSPHHFFMKVTNAESEDAFSGETIPIDLAGSEAIRDTIITNSQRYFATPREEVKKQLEILLKVSIPTKKTKKKTVKETTQDNGREIKPAIQSTKIQVV